MGWERVEVWGHINCKPICVQHDGLLFRTSGDRRARGRIYYLSRAASLDNAGTKPPGLLLLAQILFQPELRDPVDQTERERLIERELHRAFSLFVWRQFFLERCYS